MFALALRNAVLHAFARLLTETRRLALPTPTASLWASAKAGARPVRALLEMCGGASLKNLEHGVFQEGEGRGRAFPACYDTSC